MDLGELPIALGHSLNALAGRVAPAECFNHLCFKCTFTLNLKKYV